MITKLLKLYLTKQNSSIVQDLWRTHYQILLIICGCFLEYKRVNGNLIIYKCLSCNKCYLKKHNEELKKKFKNTFKFSNRGINKFILLFQKGVYSYEYVDDWERFNKTTFAEKEEFYSNLNIENIRDADYMRAKKVCKNILRIS